MYVLLPDDPHIAFIKLAVIFVSATLLGFASHSPGGLGVFDAAMLVALIEFDKEELLAGLLLFRLLYYIIPFALSLVILGVRELWLGRRAGKIARDMARHGYPADSARPAARAARRCRAGGARDRGRVGERAAARRRDRDACRMPRSCSIATAGSWRSTPRRASSRPRSRAARRPRSRCASPRWSRRCATVAAGGGARSVEFAQRVPVDRWFMAHVRPLGEAPAAAAMLLVFHDLTPLHRVEEMRADFVANASHELRTPLAALSGFIDTLQGTARDDAQARARFLAIMKTQASRMARLIDDLLVAVAGRA